MKQKFECKGKEKYNSKEEADREIFRIMYESCGGAIDLRSYKCKYCSGWHFTSNIK